MGTAPVFLVETLPEADTAVLDGPEGHHAATVRRLRAGEQLVLADGAGSTARCTVTGAGKDRLELRVRERAFVAAPQLRVDVAQALVKGERGELAVELLTEAGADGIVPWRAQRCVARWDDGPRGAKALARWRSAAAAATKQARRAWLPPVAEPVDLAGLGARAAVADLTLVLHGSATRALPDLAAAPGLPGSGTVLLVVGPEGGIAEHELAELTAAGAVAVRLGGTVLRASTAGAVALGALEALTRRCCPGE